MDKRNDEAFRWSASSCLWKTRLLWLGVCSSLIRPQHAVVQTTSALFPSALEEYDPWILDPQHGYGSPYGGFGRATRSRLAALPLFLPNTEKPHEDGQEEVATPTTPPPLHTQVRDAFGRLYVCRVYHEDELEAESLHQGMFEVPKLKTATETAASDDQAATPPVASSSSSSSTGTTTTTTITYDNKNGDANLDQVIDAVVDHLFREVLVNDAAAAAAELEDDKVALMTLAQRLKQKSGPEVIVEINKLLEPLKGLCAQTHKGWWSYEWCYDDSITQFHVEINKATSTLQVQDVTSLGSYAMRKVNFVADDADGEATVTSRQLTTNKNDLAHGRAEVARVQDSYTGGTLCPGTDKERQSVVHLICCNKATLDRRKGLVHRDNVHVTTDLMSIYDVQESKTSLCTYNITVCTPLLCEDYEGRPEDDDSDAANSGDVGANSATGGKLKDKHAKPGAPVKENESVMEILDRTLGGFCLQTETGGWWTYEICHQKNIRQYHEVVGSKKNAQGAVYTARAIEANHNLGKYQPTKFAAIVPEDEYKFVTNATTASSDAKKSAATVKKAYFELEYIDGDVCDDSDVTDAAIVAGAGQEKKLIARSSSVRYRCGDIYDIAVSEDHTCHYIVWVDLPDLCKHLLFKEPVSKKQVFKCLHVPEEMEEASSLEDWEQRQQYAAARASAVPLSEAFADLI